MATGNRQELYQAAVSLAIAEGDRVWTRFNIMCALNTAILAIPYISEIKPIPHVIILCYIAFGLTSCAIWAALHNKGFAWYSYFIAQAQRLEPSSSRCDVLGETMEKFRSGEPWSYLHPENKSIEERSFTLPCADSFGVNSLANFMIGVFLAAYIVSGALLFANYDVIWPSSYR